MSPVGSFRGNPSQDRFDFASEFGNRGLDFNDFARSLSQPDSAIARTIQNLDPTSPLLRGVNARDGIDGREARQIAGNVFATQRNGIGNLDNDPLRLSSQEFRSALGLGSSGDTPEVGAATAPEEGGSVGKSQQPEAPGSAGQPGASEAADGASKVDSYQSKKATKDWNGDGRIDMADYVFEQQLKAAAEAAGVPLEELVSALEALAEKEGSSVMEVAQKYGGENGVLDSKEEIEALLKAAGEEGGNRQDAGTANGLDDLIAGFASGADGGGTIRPAA